MSTKTKNMVSNEKRGFLIKPACEYAKFICPIAQIHSVLDHIVDQADSASKVLGSLIVTA